MNDLVRLIGDITNVADDLSVITRQIMHRGLSMELAVSALEGHSKRLREVAKALTYRDLPPLEPCVNCKHHYLNHPETRSCRLCKCPGFMASEASSKSR